MRRGLRTGRFVTVLLVGAIATFAAGQQTACADELVTSLAAPRSTAADSLCWWIFAATPQGQTRKIDFEGDTVGQPPQGFSFGHTRKVGAPGKWVVRQEQGGKFLAQIDPDRTGSRFPVAVLDGMTAANVELTVRFKPVSGQVDQAAGLVWRFQDEDNYYIVRANARENNVVLYKVENGRRTDLPLKGEGRTYGKPADVPAGQWSTLRLVANRNVFEVYFNGTKLYEIEDATFTAAGKVGVWTKADSVTYFDDLTVITK
ncbi:MAG: hypothetical protein HY337_09220 [Gemmatimonadetes bacterium]|nr:hypothetical protein [Gemmatimonadota bacterium]